MSVLTYVERLGLSKRPSMADTIKSPPSKQIPRNTSSGVAGNEGVYKMQIGNGENSQLSHGITQYRAHYF